MDDEEAKLLQDMKEKFNAAKILDDIRESDYFPKAFRSPGALLFKKKEPKS